MMFAIHENGVLKMIIDADDYKIDLSNRSNPVVVFSKSGLEGFLCDEDDDEQTPYIDWIPKGRRAKVKEARVRDKKHREEKDEKDKKDKKDKRDRAEKDHRDKVEKEKKEREREERDKKDRDDKEKKGKDNKDKKDKKDKK
jgi:hypothetical protein